MLVGIDHVRLHNFLLKFILQMSTLTFGHFSLIFLATPVMVPPVPAPRTTMSTLPENKSQTNTFSAVHVSNGLKLVFSHCFKNDKVFSF